MQLKELIEQNKVIELATLTTDRDLIGEIQTRLSSLGFLNANSINGGIDHIFGPVTKAALTSFCTAVHLNNMRTGLFGPTFAQKLINARPPIVTTDLTTLGGVPFSSNILAIALKFTLLWEGGFVNNPLDPGGATNRGITQFTYDVYRINQHLPIRSVVNIAEEEVQDIYYSMYWKPSQAELAVEPLAVVLFDTAVNFGVGGAIEFLQEALGIGADGIFGPVTREAFLENNNKTTAEKMVAGRIVYRHQRVSSNSSQDIFLQGWLNRDNDLKDYIIGLG